MEIYRTKSIVLFCCICWGVSVPTFSLADENVDNVAVERTYLTITANKMVEDIQEVPQSVTVLEEYLMDEKGITVINDVIKEIPNMRIFPGIHGNSVSIRGLIPSKFTDNNPVVLYIDGVPTSNRYGFSGSLANAESVEVLRGPQGTLYGKDAIGGVINIVTKKPTNSIRGKLGFEYGNFNFINSLFSIGGPAVKDTFFIGINGQYRQDDGWIENINPAMDSDANTSKDQRLSGNFLYTPTARFSARFTISNDITQESWKNGYALPATSDFSDFNRDDAEEVNFDTPSDIEQERFAQSLILTYDFDTMTLTSTTTYHTLDMDGEFDADAGNSAPYTGLKQFNYSKSETYTQELRVSSNNTTGIRWLSGVYLDIEDREQKPYGIQFLNYDPVTFACQGAYEMNAESETNSHTYALFGQLMIPLANRFELTLGGRYQHIDKEIELLTYYLPVGTTGAAFYSYSGEKEWDIFLPKAALSYSLNDTWTTYVSYSHGYMPGGYNYFASTGTAVDNSFEPQTSKNYEIGIKGSLDKLRLASSIFYMDIKDIHVYKSYGPNLYFTDNAQSAHSKGIELELEYSLTDSIDLTGSFGIIQAEYDTYDAGNNISFDGQEIQNTPAYTANLSFAYYHPNGFYSRLDMRAAGETYFYKDGDNSFVKEDPFVTVATRIGYQTPDWDFYIYGKNLTDEDYVVDLISNSMLMVAGFGDPLTVGAGVRYRF